MTARRTLRFLLAPLTCAALTYLVAGAVRAWRESALQGWGGLGIGWLGVERWSAERALVPALVAAALVLVLGFSRGRTLRRVRFVVRRLGHPLSVALALALLLVPNVAVRVLRPAPPRTAPGVLFVVVDTWRADHAGFLGYERRVSPRLDRLAKSGVVFERAIAQSSWTKPSVATLLTGLVPAKHRAVSQAIPETPVRAFQLNGRITTLVELLHGLGWQTAMWSDNPNITPPVGFAQGAESFRDYFHAPCCEDCGRIDEVAEDVRVWLEGERDPGRPFCLYVHVMDPHYPFEPPARFAGRFDHSPSDLQLTGPIVQDYMTGKRDEARLTPERLKSLVDRYDEELLAVDQSLGALIEGVLREHPDTVVVLAGDHGEEFLEHGNLGHGHALWEELVHVPLVLWAPGLAATRIRSQVRLMDVTPTVLDLVGMADHLPSVQGKSLLPLVAGLETADRIAPMEVGGDQKPCWQWRGLSDGRLKLLRRESDLATLHPIPPLGDDDSRERPRWHLYDLAADPGEHADLFASRPEDARRLFDELVQRGWYVAPEELLGMPAATIDVDPHLADELGALGYGTAEGDAHSP